MKIISYKQIVYHQARNLWKYQIYIYNNLLNTFYKKM